MSAILRYFLSLVAAGLLSTLLLSLLPEGGVRRVLRLACGLVMLLVCVSPILNIQTEDVAEWLSRLEISSDEASHGIELQTQQLIADIISEKVSAYVWDKAQSLGLEIETEVRMNVEGSYPYPEGIEIRGQIPESQKEVLQRYIESNFAIPEDRQVYLP